MNKNLLIGGGVLLAVIVAGFFLVQKKAASVPVVNQNAVTETSVSGTPNPNAKEFNVTATEFAFSPSTISVKKGDVVRINLLNNGTFSHNLTFANLNLGTKTIASGESDSLEFTADKTGSFGFTCTVDSHKDKGMAGTLTVN
jgi:plastocyanin